MVGGAQQPQLQSQSQPTTTIPATTTTTTSAEEAALKRNTDCIYFLASPLTCKKGSECEYRHSDIARVNPRDCWYWLNGNCLNPKCAFRHPPLDGLLGAQTPTPARSSMAQSQTAAAPATHAQYSSSKQAVPCIFFQKGLCLKGDKCSFLHAPNTTNNKVPQVAAAAPFTEPPTPVKTFGGLERCTHEKKISQTTVPMPIELRPKAKPVAKVEITLPKNVAAVHKNMPPPSGLDDEFLRYRPTDVPPANNGDSISRSAHVSDSHNILNGRDAYQLSREPSPGFDVLVDDELGDSDYYHNEDQFGRTQTHEGRNSYPMNEYDGADYNDVDQNIYRDSRGYDPYERMQGQFGWEQQRRASSERMVGGLANLERRQYPRGDSPDQIDGSDLRHRLSKQRRVNGLRSVISQEYANDDRDEDRSYRGSRREARHVTSREGSLSSRLRGRIKIPERSSSPVNRFDLRAEREMDGGRIGGRLSPGRPQISSHQGRLRDRIKGRLQEDFNDEGRNFRGLRNKRDIINDNDADFAAPKRLSELKVGKNSDSDEQQIYNQQSLSLGRRKYPTKLEGRQQTEGDLSFEGPKPLSEILKRKRVSDDYDQKESVLEEANLVHGSEGESKFAADDNGGSAEEGLIPTKRIKSTDGESSPQCEVSQLEMEDGMIIGDEAVEYHGTEAYDQRDGDSDYEQVDGEDFNLEEGEHADQEDEYVDDDDGDDFAKKIGVMFS
ncbi:zinc finger CCCH domain-containing protein 17 [Cornus florida]|uniref:zinc finger CCCH domain-containing protein 17 n=1 Tax=Cornus florida TaxID=4283 RepID=UPI0028A1B85F|nr:zinc finger CCCH domain-containing protein 17 [Cornus florida]